MSTAITGTMLRDLVQCERRFELDLRGPADGRDAVSAFVQMLWSNGSIHEDEVVASLDGSIVDLRTAPTAERAALTAGAIASRPDWIVGGRIESGDRVGVPDLLHFAGGRVFAGDIKSGGAFDDAGRPRREYAVQVAHYAAIAADLRLGARDQAFVIGADREISWYQLDAPRGRAVSVNEDTDQLLEVARTVRDGGANTRPALSAGCYLCHWRTVCRADLDAADDLTLVAGLGRALRQVIEPVAPSVTALAGLDLASFGERGRALPGLGMGRLGRFQDRARLLRTPGARPFARRALEVSRYAHEIHFDIEADPLRGGLVYLHGAVELRNGRERYVSFFADRPEDEGTVFAAAYSFLTADPAAHIFYYSKFERTSFRVLARRYPTVCSAEDIELMFSPGRSTDLLGDVVQPHTEWPTHGVGLKPLAKFLGFNWRDVDPSGAASIAWFDEWLRTGDPSVRDRILMYNEDDCRSTVTLLTALVDLPVSEGVKWPPRLDDAAAR